MQSVSPPLVLASRSPRRLELLRLAGCEPLVVVAEVDEERLTRDYLGASSAARSISSERASGLTAHLAWHKAVAIRSSCPDAVVLGADTLVWLEGKILGQPADAAAASHMLHRLSGRSHIVHTAVALCYPAAMGRPDWRFEAATRVDFWPLTEVQERLIAAYVAAGLSFGKAGAYGIQDQGALFVRSICGDYGTVVGLPLAAVMHELFASGCLPPPLTDGSMPKI